MRISVITAVYKDIEALQLIVKALKKQNYKNFELVVAEDNNDSGITNYLDTVSGIDIIHTTQDDNGIRKARSQNNAILKSTGDYLIFIDGDCIPYPNFVSSHATLSEKGHVLSGRRVNLGSRISQLIRKGLLKASTLANNYLLFSPILLADHASHFGQGVYLSPDSYLYNKYISLNKKSNLNILGCNFSCFREDIIAIDGFDESYGETAVPDDTDIQWRFLSYGLRLKTCKLSANMFHLYHTRTHQLKDASKELERMHKRKAIGNYMAEIGLSSHG
ncbi:glycosyltransferase [Candidatus Pacearchaeota archaeon]|nr:glycosyltransferase [Candidatus Pacearchaeota archaeon]